MPPCDLVTLYAYADRSHTQERELWQSFLLFLMPMLLELGPKEAEYLLESAIVNSPEEALATPARPRNGREGVRLLSARLAQEIGAPVELAVAALMDFHPPTRTIGVLGVANRKKKDALLNQWILSFSRLPGESPLGQVVDMVRASIAMQDMDEAV